MATRRLYRENPYLDSNEAVVLEILSKDGCDVLVTDQSVFFPEGGGQPCDTGYVEKGDDIYAVTSCYDESLDGNVYHLTDAPFGTFAIGDEVNLAIDWSRRFINMQRHLGEHMLSGAIYNLFGGVNRGFHMGEEYVTIDIELAQDAQGTKTLAQDEAVSAEHAQGTRLLTQDEIDLAETTVNWNIWMNLPVSTKWFETNEESKSMPLRKYVPHDGRISVVIVGDPGEPFDCIACCGTHPSSTGQVGLLSIYKIETNKGMTRIYFDCGVKALRKLEEDSAVLGKIAASKSCSSEDLEDRLAKEDERNSELRARLAACSSYIKEKEKLAICEMISNDASDMADGKADSKAANTSAVPSSNRIYVYENKLLETGDLLKIGFDIADKLLPSQLLLLMDAATSTLLLYAGTKAEACESKAAAPNANSEATTKTHEDKAATAAPIDCGKLLREHVKTYNGKGGGRPDSARASFSNNKDMLDFVDFIRKISEEREILK